MAEIFRGQKYDTGLCFSHNIGPLRNNDVVKNDPDHISDDTRLVVDATCFLLYTNVIGSATYTSGDTILGVPPEARSQRYFAMEHYPRANPSNSHIEIDSWDTSTNAEYSIEQIRGRGHKTVAAIGIGRHAENGAMYLENLGQPVAEVFKAEEVIYEALRILDPAKAAQFKKDFRTFYHLSGNGIKELIRSGLIRTVDPHGHFLRAIAHRSRKQ